MGSPVINVDMILEVFSYSPASEIGKLRLLNKECNKRSYESWFLKLHLHRSKSIFGYFLQSYQLQTKFVHENTGFEDNKVSINFLPLDNVKIKACDASHHGILLCLSDTTPEKYIVCKPTTEQYQFIPNPNSQSRAISFGLAVIQSNPFRYKILGLSMLPRRCSNLRTLVCEVFDSDTFAWKRLKNLRLPKNDGLIISKPVHAYGFLHWLSRNNNVIRFCLKTEAWSLLPIPNFGVHPTLVRYQGKLGVIRWWMACNGEELNRLWVLKSSFDKIWVKVKDMKIMELSRNISETPGDDVVMLSSRFVFVFDTAKTRESVRCNCFTFCSDYNKVDLNAIWSKSPR